MTRMGITLALFLAITACTKSPKEKANPRPGFSDNGVAAQQRIGRYLQDSVVTAELRTCWGQLKGESAVAMDLTYRKSGNNWTFDNAKVKKSTLPEGQDAIAQRCIEESARETSFAVDSKENLETLAQQFVVRLGWSVPLPVEGTELTPDQIARMIGGAGVITMPGCSTCELQPGGYKCVAKSSGSDMDCEEIQSNICATTPKACMRGAFGGTSGIIMY